MTRKTAFSWRCVLHGTSLFLALALVPSGAASQDVPVLELGAVRLGAAPVLEILEEEVLLGAAAGDPATRFSAMALDAMGRIHLLDAESRRVLSVAPSSGDPSTIELPPEPSQLLSIAAARDTIMVLGISGREGRPRPSLLIVTRDGASSELDLAVLARGVTGIQGTDAGWVTALHLVDPRTFVRPEPTADTMVLALVDPGGTGVTPVFRYWTGADRYMVAPGRTITREGAFRPSHTIARDGLVYTVTSDEYEITVRDISGEVLQVIRGDVERTPFPPERFDRELERQAERARAVGDTTWAETLEAAGPRVGHADFLPVLGSIIASSGGRIMARRLDLEALATPGASGQIWDLLDREDGVIGRLRTPGSFAIAAFEWPYVYGIQRSAVDQSPVRYRVNRPGAPAPRPYR